MTEEAGTHHTIEQRRAFWNGNACVKDSTCLFSNGHAGRCLTEKDEKEFGQ